MQQFGQVVDVEGQYATVIMKRHASCGSCNACKMGAEDKPIEIQGINQVKAQVGEWVAVDLEETNLVSAALVSYAIPLFMLLVGVIGGQAVLKALQVVERADIYSGLIGLVSMGLAFLFIRLNEKRRVQSGKYLPVIGEIVEEDRLGC